ncbi:MAG: cysteine synthase A [Clostridia bacterium]|nr:cysteine synthase A [Clostridia bacterium]
MKIFNSFSELIGNTPLLRLSGIEKKYSLSASIIAKLEMQNPAGSIKDRVALRMIEAALGRGEITKDSVIIEPTSGNTGIGIAAVCASLGMRAIIVMPDTMSVERIKLMKVYGAEVVLTDGALGMNGAVARAEEICRETKGAVIAGQFYNPDNPMAHELSTAPEIWEACNGKIDILVAGIGTGGTVSGVGRFLKSKKPDVRVVGVEPLSSPLLTEGRSGAHKIQGIGANFVPKNFDRTVVDEIIAVSDEDAVSMTRMLPKTEGVLAGISSGAALYAAVELARREENKGKRIVVIFPDSGTRYLSGELFEV